MLALAAITVAVEVADLAGAVAGVDVGRITLSASLVPAIALAVVCGHRLLGEARTRVAATVFWAVALASLALAALAYLRTDHPADVVGLVLAAFDEELVYRLAVPALVALVLRGVKVAPPAARIAGFVAAGAWFALLPGHRGQMASPAEAVPFAAFAALSALMVYRSGSVLPMVIAHACSNLLTILVWSDTVGQGARSAVLGSLLLVMMFAYGETRRYVRTDDGALVDLRSGRIVELDLRDRPPSPAQPSGAVSSARRR